MPKQPVPTFRVPIRPATSQTAQAGNPAQMRVRPIPQAPLIQWIKVEELIAKIDALQTRVTVLEKKLNDNK